MDFYVTDTQFPHLGGNANGGDGGTYDEVLWSKLVDHFHSKSVLDIGCGEGHALKKFKELGLDVFGVEGLKRNVEICNKKDLPVIELDLTLGPLNMTRTFDLVWCCEVVEHIEEKFIDNLFKTFQRGKILTMTFAVPGQWGYHHVNCQDESYWVDKLKDYGFEYLEELSIEFRTKYARNGTFFNRTGLILDNLKFTGKISFEERNIFKLISEKYGVEKKEYIVGGN